MPHSAMIDERGGNLHPLNYALGLAAAALKAGAILHGGSRVTKMTLDGTGHLLTAEAGQLRARIVLICTHGYTSDVTPPLHRTVVPIRSVCRKTRH